MATHTPGPWVYQEWGRLILDSGKGSSQMQVATVALNTRRDEGTANAKLIAAAPELLEALIRAQDFIDGIRQDLHNQRSADWYSEGANNAALEMSESMRLIGNSCADFDVGAVIAKATGEA